MPLRTLVLLATFYLLLYANAGAVEKHPDLEARNLINALGCKGCHTLEADGASLAPELDQIGSRMTRAQINQHLAAHAESRQQGFMPSYNTTPKEDLEKISNFLYNLK